MRTVITDEVNARVNHPPPYKKRGDIMSKWYSFKKIDEQDCLFNFVISMRSAGKTIAMKNKMLDIAKKGKRFVYIRRSATETKSSAMDEFFNKIFMLGYHTDMNGIKFEKDCFILDKNVIGYVIPLSTSNNARSMDFNDIDAIFFEEFILMEDDKHKYLKDEVFKFLELYSTIARDNDIKVYFIGNMIQLYNPYFIYFDLRPPTKGIKKWNDMAIEVWKSDTLEKEKNNTRFGRIIANTSYADYSIHNNSFETNNNLIRKMDKGSKPLFDFKYQNVIYGVWQCGTSLFFSNVKTNKNIVVAVTERDRDNNSITIKGFKQLWLYRYYRNAVYNNLLFATSDKMEQVSRSINKYIST